MTKQKSTKRALLLSALSLLMCVSMLIGSTFAWFTDSVTSKGNIIKSGTLDVTMEWADGKTDPANTSWTDAAEGAIFNYDLWEPGYTEVRHIKIANAGTLALKYQLNIVANGDVSKLADVIDVYYLDPAAAVADRADLTADQYIGTLTEVLAAISTTASGNLLAGENHTVTLALKMRESAGNEYQGLSIGSDFSVQLMATQLTHENDSFNNQYDVDAPVTEVATAEELQKVLNEGGYAKLTADIASPNNKRIDIPANTIAVIDLNGHTLTSKDGGGSNTMAVYVDKGAQLTLNDSVGTGKIVSSCYGVYVKQNAKFIMNGGTISVSGNNVFDYGVTVWNAAFIMNGGTIDSRFAVWASNYYRDAGETGLNDCYVKIADGCTVNSTGYADVEYADALDAVLHLPADLTTYPATVSTAAELNEVFHLGSDGTIVKLAEGVDYGKIYVGSGHGVTTVPKNITVIGAEGATLDLAVRSAFEISGWTFKNVNFSGDGMRTTNDAVAKGITFDGCSFNGASYMYLKAGSEDITITDCTFIGDGTQKAIYIQGATNVTVSGCTFKNVTTAVNVGGTGKIVVSGNTINGTTDRPLRFASADATITVSGNTIVSEGDNGQLMKADGGVTAANITLSGNTWNGKTDSEVSAGMVDSAYIVQ